MLELKNNMEKALQQISVMSGDVHDIKNIITGHPLIKEDKGYVGFSQENRSRIERLEKFNSKMIYLLVGLSFGTGWAVSDLIVKIFIK